MEIGFNSLIWFMSGWFINNEEECKALLEAFKRNNEKSLSNREMMVVNNVLNHLDK